MSMEGGIHMDLSIGNFPVTHTAIREYLYRPIIELIASENYASPAVMEAQGSA
jgi:glycine/serine hydroxymethyltransferase